jgi:hypothetical protein
VRDIYFALININKIIIMILIVIITVSLIRWAGQVTRMGEGRGVHRLGKPRRSWEDNIKMDLTEVWIGVANWIRLAQVTVRWLAFVNTIMNLRVS